MRRIPILSLLRTLFQGPNATTQVETGQTESRVNNYSAFSAESIIGRHYDQERRPMPVRDAARARALARIAAVPEAATCIDSICTDAFSSQDGDTLGFRISDTLADDETLVDPEVQRIAQKCINRIMPDTELKTVAQEMLETGDSFRSLVLNQGISRIERVKELPVWEMFRVEDFDGNIVRFDQRRWLQDGDALEIHPVICVHWRFRRNSLYGRALFEEMVLDAESLAKGFESIDKAAISIGVNPNKHIMPAGTDEEFREGYKRNHEQRVRTGKTITDYYLLPAQNGEDGPDGDVQKVSDTYKPDLNALLSNTEQRRRRFAMKGHTPLWLLALESKNAQDIAGQPAMARSRFINSFRSDLTKGIKQIIDLELALNGIFEAEYQLEWPAIMVNTMEAAMTSNDDSNTMDAQSELDFWRAKHQQVRQRNGVN